MIAFMETYADSRVVNLGEDECWRLLETAEMGRWAVATLTERIKAARGEPGPAEPRPLAAAARRIVPVHLEVRASTAPPPAG